ncbi:MAG TPA: biotin--[acetyl-CoA-carboxylase] ligase [Kiritimatiellia bacterium]|jgi:BirA family biotin operon repressor/biotin-[acetyl-CoA-carboxylase] ligase|nr:biotin--[acetyl-CoA-carboxylase] ligase [Kiritimatiellia bacterium]HOM58755.1 biotin--[acetyl-CoA-carboxylase] ligase [Kiritimatiellia bacterium]HOR96835.1 biotin--[acetyl-CoA-carboxylase] ligase [Kiritimatiellia bacterium]HPC48773.1 biotin--[acetyl-CoA-carboxylase] ligase [Kiritimatiellia bacterium]HPW75072.1 biotin--[acetyl-CoA-carboxylase] ligase [Kiritimatiellia bacterium]
MRATDEILTALRQAAGGEVSSRALCDRLGVSRAAIWKRIEALRGLGYGISASPRRGYRLESVPDLPHAAEVLPLLSTRRIGRDCRYVAETGSTNRDAAVLAQAGAEEGLVVTAGSQHAGRGRMTRVWFSPAGVNLYFSLVLRPAVEPLRAASLPLVAGLAVAEAVADLAPELQPAVKWPNDILVAGRKLCGILCEMQAEIDCVRHIVLGVGVNVNLERASLPEEIRSRATSLRMACGRSFSRAAVLAAILNHFEPLYDQWLRKGLEPLITRLDARDALRGRMITLESGGGQTLRGRADGIQADGALRLVTERGPVTLYSGETHIGT